MIKKNFIPHNEEGSVLIISLIMLVLLTLIGMSSTTTTQIDIQISGNERSSVRDFYVADSVWRQGVQHLNALPSAPILTNKTITLETDPDYYNVRNFGNGDDGELNATFPSNTQDGTLGLAPHTTDYWFKDAYTDSSGYFGYAVPGSGGNYRKFDFIVTSNVDSNRKKQIEITASKVFKVGY